MTPTLLGLAFLLIGLAVMLTGSRQDMLAYVMTCALFNGSASVVLGGLGNTSVQPAVVATGLLALRCVLPDRRAPSVMAASLSANGWLVLFVGWSVLGAFTLPFLFSGELQVVPLRPSDSPTGLETHALHFTPQNVTTAVYLLATLAASICAYVAASEVGATLRIARLASVVALAHAAIGWVAMGVQNTPLAAVVQFFRNGSYMQLDQSFGGFARITGISPETSLYVSFGYAWFVFTAELWLRNVDRRWSGMAALTMFGTLLASTSSTAYVGLGAYGLLLALRLLYFAGAVPARKALVLGAVALALLVGGLAAVAGSEAFAGWAARMLRMTTTDKLGSTSGVARLFWAQQGLAAFAASGGLGIGVGSFRSSSIVTAIIGSGGVIGIVGFALHLGRIFHPFEPSTWRANGEPMVDVAKAACWAAVMMLVPAAVSAPSPDPGLLWGLIAGTSLGLRQAAALTRPEAAQRRRRHNMARPANASISVPSGAARGGPHGYRPLAEGPARVPGLPG